MWTYPGEGNRGSSLASNVNPTRTAALDRMTQALEAAKRARDRGTNVSWARTALKEARSAFEAGNYGLAMERANFILGRLGPGLDAPPALAIPPPPPTSRPISVPTLGDLGAAAGRLAEAKEVVKQAKARGFNVQAAKAALKRAKRSLKVRDYWTTVESANEAIVLSGSAGLRRP